jgi:threonine dehydratase
MSEWPIRFEDVLAARERLRPHLAPSPLRAYPGLDEAVGGGIRILVKHENLQPTGAFKVRNALAALTLLEAGERRRGVVAATRGNHGLGLAWAGRRLGVPVTVVVPHGNNPEKNDAMRSLGARLVEEGHDYDACAAAVDRLVREEGLHLVHSTNDPAVVAGAGTVTLEILEEDPGVDALVFTVGGGSQAVGALTVVRERRPGLPVYAVQAAGAAAIHDA